jgi:acetyl esterase
MPLDPDAKTLMDALKGLAAMPGPQTEAAAYRAASKARQVPRQALQVARVEDLSIPGPGGELRLRFYDDAPGALRPTLVFYHGGGFVVGDLDSHDELCRRLAKASGWAVLAVDYRLAPEARYPAAFDDAYAALLWAAGPQAHALGVDAARLAVGGDSAGGNLAAAVALAARDRSGPALRHQLLIYPVIDHDFTTASYLDADPDYFLTAEAMQWFWAQYLGEDTDRADPFAAPGRASDLSRLPPATVVTAGYDPLRDEGEHYAERLKAAGVEAASRRYDGVFHGFVSMDMLAGARDATAWIAERLKAA